LMPSATEVIHSFSVLNTLGVPKLLHSVAATLQAKIIAVNI
jgi:hypothetical protein